MEIIKLIEKLKAGTIMPEELKRLKTLLEDTEASKELLSSFQESFDRFTSSNKEKIKRYPNKERSKERLIQSIQYTEKDIKRKHPLTKIAISLSIAALLAIVGFLFLNKVIKQGKSSIDWTLVETAYGEKKKINLYDGSTVVMNGNSSVYYSRSPLDSVRLVKLEGEAYFDIMPDDKKPFFVITNKFITHVLGTSFNIDSKIENLIEVASGEVNVFAIDDNETNSILNQPLDLKSNLQSLIRKNRTISTTLTEGKTARLSNHEWLVSSFNNNNWHNNVLVCLNEPLHKIAEKAYRFYGDSIYVAPTLAMKKLSITFSNASINHVVETLSELSNGELEYDEKNKIWNIMKK